MLVKLLTEHPENIELNIHYLPFDPSIKYFGEIVDRQFEIAEAKRQIAISEFFPHKYQEYLLNRSKYMTMYRSDSLVFDWAAAATHVGIDPNELTTLSLSTIVESLYTFNVNQTSQQSDIVNSLVNSISSMVFMNDMEFKYDFSDFFENITTESTNGCYDELATFIECISSEFEDDGHEWIAPLVPIKKNGPKWPKPKDVVLTLIFAVLDVAECIEDAKDPTNIYKVDEDCQNGEYCFQWEYHSLGVVETEPLFTRAECLSCPTVKISNNNNGSNFNSSFNFIIETPEKAEPGSVYGFFADEMPDFTVSYALTLNGALIGDATLVTLPGYPPLATPYLPTSPRTLFVSKNVEDYIKTMVPGDRLCLEVTPWEPDAMVNGCGANLKRCIEFDCPEAGLWQDDNALMLSVLQNKQGALLSAIKYKVIITPPNDVIETYENTTTKSGLIPLVDVNGIQILLSNYPEHTTICVEWMPQFVHKNDLIECEGGTDCFEIGVSEGCTNLTIDIAYCSLPQIPGGFDGTLIVKGEGGISPYSFLWDNGIQGPGLIQLEEGAKRCVTIYDSSSPTTCSATRCFRLTSETCCVDNQQNQKNYYTDKNAQNKILAPTCFEIENLIIQNTSLPDEPNFPDGSITVITSEPGNYSYSWSDLNAALITKDRTNLSPGLYCVTVTSYDDCCYDVACIEIVPSVCEQNPVQATVSTTPACNGNDGTASVEFSGGTDPITIEWSIFGNDKNDQTINGLNYDLYAVTVTDGNGCKARDQGWVGGIDPDAPLILTENITSAKDCQNNGEIELIVQTDLNILSYQWSNGATTKDIKNIASGIYSVTVTAECGYVEGKDFFVPDNSLTDVKMSITNACNPNGTGAIEITSSNTYVEFYDENNTFISNQNPFIGFPGIYKMIVTNSSTNCKLSKIVTIEVASINNIEFSEKKPTCVAGCDGLLIALPQGGTPPYYYNWQHNWNFSFINNLTSGTYSVTITDANGCTQSGEHVLTSEANPCPEIIISLKEKVNANCDRLGSLAAEGSGGYGPPYNFKWSNGISQIMGGSPAFSQITDLQPGIYSVTVEDRCGQQEVAEFEIIEELPDVSFSVEILQQPCEVSGNFVANGTIIIHTTGHINLPYRVRYQRKIFGANSNFYGDLIFDEIPGNKQVYYLPPGDYTVTLMECPYTTVNFTLYPLEYPEIDDIIIHDETCRGDKDGSIFLQMTAANSPHTFNWSNNGGNQPSIINLASGSYRVTITGANFCSLVRNFQVDSHPNINVHAATTDACTAGEGGEIDIDISGGTPPFQYIWSNGATTEDLSNIPAGNYTATIVDGVNGCQKKIAVDVGERGPQIVVKNISPAYYTDPPDEPWTGATGEGAITIDIIGIDPPFTIQWENGENTQTVYNLASGDHTVTVIDSRGCATTQTIFVPICELQGEGVGIFFPIEDIIPCSSGHGSLRVESWSPGIISYSWTGPSGTGPFPNSDRIDINKAGRYCVKATDACGRVARICKDMECGCPIEDFFAFRQVDPCLDWWDFTNSYLSLFDVLDWLAPPRPKDFIITWSGPSGWKYNGQKSFCRVGVAPWADSGYGGNPSFYTINGPNAGRLDIDEEGTYMAHILTDQGCEYNFSFDFLKRVDACFWNSDYLREYTDRFVGDPYNAVNVADRNYRVIVGGFKCKTCDGIECQTAENSFDFQYFPNDQQEPCKGGGSIRGGCITSPCNNNPNLGTCVDVFPVEAAWATEYVDYSSSTPSQREGFCLFEAGCYFPTVVGIPGPVWVSTVKEAPCNTLPPDEDPDQPDCPTQINEFAPNCFLNTVCVETGEVLESEQFDFNKCYFQRTEGMCEIIEYCSIYPTENRSAGLFSCDAVTSQDITSCVYVHGIIAKTSPGFIDENGDEILNLTNADNKLYSLYPNPFKDYVHVKINEHDAKELTYYIFDALGKLIKKESIGLNSETFSITIKLDTFLQGVYFFRIFDNEGNYFTEKLIKN
ncbi:MAG TPA: T9SS type A sorting domain-containing protein [Niabella sp.]|nr:T9SS type A sorting domain-containing protein [Niabella sp.]